MPVRLEEIAFQNNNGIRVCLTIEAPVGNTVVDRHPVEGGTTHRIQPGAENCLTVLLLAEADSPGHGIDREELTVAGRPTKAFISHVAARYVIGSIDASLTGRTERG